MKMRQLPDGSGDGRRKKNRSGEDGSYELFKLAMETDEERKARLKKMVATTQLRLAPTKEELDWNICQITQSIYLTTYT